MSVSVKIRALTASFGARVVLNGIDIDIEKGRVLAVIGESGSGKSTLLRLIAGLERASAGDIAFDSAIVASPIHFVAPERRRVGFVFQDFALFPHMRALENVAFGLAHLDQQARASQAQLWLDKVGLGARARAYPHELSGGEQQRVALARAMAPEPGLILFDEPFSGLDPGLRADLRDTALDALRGAEATAIFVTHDIEEALYVADTLAILKAGRLLQAGPAQTVYDAPNCLEAASALGPVNEWRGQCRVGVIATPFGDVATTLPDGPARAVVRAEAIEIHPGARVRILARRLVGAMVHVTLECDGVVWKALAPRHNLGVEHDRCDVQLNPRGVFAYSDGRVSG